MRILRSAHYRRMPWKNGGGETREIAMSPAGGSLDALEWRISLATVASDGPFSTFNGVTRTLCVIHGAGIELHVGEAPPRTLLPTSEPFTFDGESPARASLIDGPIVDLNVMSRRGRARHQITRRIVSGSSELTTVADSTIVFCRAGTLLCSAGAHSGELNAEDCAIVEGRSQVVRLSSSERADVHVIELYRESARSDS